MGSNRLFAFIGQQYFRNNRSWQARLAERSSPKAMPWRENVCWKLTHIQCFPLYLSVVNHVIFTLCILVHPCARLVLSQCRIFASSTISKMGAQQMEVMRGDWVNCRFWLCSTQAWAARDFMSTTATSSLMRAYRLRLLMRVCEEVLTLLTVYI